MGEERIKVDSDESEEIQPVLRKLRRRRELDGS